MLLVTAVKKVECLLILLFKSQGGAKGPDPEAPAGIKGEIGAPVSRSTCIFSSLLSVFLMELVGRVCLDINIVSLVISSFMIPMMYLFEQVVMF